MQNTENFTKKNSIAWFLEYNVIQAVYMENHYRLQLFPLFKKGLLLEYFKRFIQDSDNMFISYLFFDCLKNIFFFIDTLTACSNACKALVAKQGW